MITASIVILCSIALILIQLKKAYNGEIVKETIITNNTTNSNSYNAPTSIGANTYTSTKSSTSDRDRV